MDFDLIEDAVFGTVPGMAASGRLDAAGFGTASADTAGVDDASADTAPVTIAVIGIGGAGCNMVNGMIARNIHGVRFYAVNTDLQDLRKSPAEKVQIGKKLTGGRGAGGNPEVGAKAAQEDENLIRDLLQDVNMVFLAAGMGGGTGTGAAPVIAQAAKSLGILTVAVVTKPFTFEGEYRMELAEAGIAKLQGAVDTIIILPNQKLMGAITPTTPLLEAFDRSNEVLRQGVESMLNLILKAGFINIDFADAEQVLRGQGQGLMVIGEAEGDNRAEEAASRAMNNDLLDETSITGAKGVLIYVACGEDFGLYEYQKVIDYISVDVDKKAKKFCGMYIEPELGKSVRVTVIATGFERAAAAAAAEAVEERPPSDTISLSEFDSFKSTPARGLPPRSDYSRDNFSKGADGYLDIPAAARDKRSGLGQDLWGRK